MKWIITLFLAVDVLIISNNYYVIESFDKAMDELEVSINNYIVLENNELVFDYESINKYLKDKDLNAYVNETSKKEFEVVLNARVISDKKIKDKFSIERGDKYELYN